MCGQVLRYTLYNKERSSFVDASFLHNDWWQKVRDLFHPPSEDEEEEECTEGDPDCEDEEEVRKNNQGPCPNTLRHWKLPQICSLCQCATCGACMSAEDALNRSL